MVAADRHLGQELGQGHGHQGRIVGETAQEGLEKGPDGLQPAGGSTTTPRASVRDAFSKWTKERLASSCSAPSTGSSGWAVKRPLNVALEPMAGIVAPWPRSRVKGWANV